MLRDKVRKKSYTHFIYFFIKTVTIIVMLRSSLPFERLSCVLFEMWKGHEMWPHMSGQLSFGCPYGNCWKCESTMLSALSNPEFGNFQVIFLFEKIRDGPWVPIKKVKKLVNMECPPCSQPMQVDCLGKHEVSELPCHKAIEYNCGRKCGNMLKCTHHKCEFECHAIVKENVSFTDFLSC